MSKEFEDWFSNAAKHLTGKELYRAFEQKVKEDPAFEASLDTEIDLSPQERLEARERGMTDFEFAKEKLARLYPRPN